MVYMPDKTVAAGRIASQPSLLARSAAALHYDFCPWANRWVYWLKNPLWCLVLAMACAVICGFCVSSRVFIIAAALGAVLLIGIVWPWLSMRGIHCELSFALHRIREGEAAPAVLRVRNRYPWPAWGLVLDRGWGGHDGESGQLALARVPGWTSSVFNWEFMPSRRGVYPFAPPELATRFPFGLFRAALRVAVDRELIVWPRTVSLQSLPDAVEIDPREERFSERHVGDAGEILGTRNFRQGDSLRRIHWPQSARHLRLIVCERQAPATCAVTLTVNLEPCAFAGCDGACLEQVIRVAASVCESLHRQHADVECRIGPDVFRIGRSAAGLQRLMDFLARVPYAGLPRVAGLLGATGRMRSRLAILVTTDLAAAMRHRDHLVCPSQRLIVVRSERPPAANSAEPIAVCQSWIEVDSAVDLASEFPERWRRACRVA
jgi:uncharacterized protein (DUF58 family)